jgi:DNA gyrase inhibitor GyrI
LIRALPLNHYSIVLTPQTGGVYALYTIESKIYKLFYIGQTNNLLNGISEHLMVSESNPCIRNKILKYQCGFSYKEIPDQSERNRIESILIQRNNPACNIN